MSLGFCVVYSQIGAAFQCSCIFCRLCHGRRSRFKLGEFSPNLTVQSAENKEIYQALALFSARTLRGQGQHGKKTAPSRSCFLIMHNFQVKISQKRSQMPLLGFFRFIGILISPYVCLLIIRSYVELSEKALKKGKQRFKSIANLFNKHVKFHYTSHLFSIKVNRQNKSLLFGICIFGHVL